MLTLHTHITHGRPLLDRTSIQHEWKKKKDLIIRINKKNNCYKLNIYNPLNRIKGES